MCTYYVHLALLDTQIIFLHRFSILLLKIETCGPNALSLATFHDVLKYNGYLKSRNQARTVYSLSITNNRHRHKVALYIYAAGVTNQKVRKVKRSDVEIPPNLNIVSSKLYLITNKCLAILDFLFAGVLQTSIQYKKQ